MFIIVGSWGADRHVTILSEASRLLVVTACTTEAANAIAIGAERMRLRVVLWKSMDERRRYPRIAASVPVEYRVGSFGALIHDESLDISEGGFFLRTTRTHALGDVVSFRIITESENGVIEGQAQVVRVKDDGPEHARGLGLSFTSLEEPSRSMMLKLVELHASQRSEPT